MTTLKFYLHDEKHFPVKLKLTAKAKAYAALFGLKTSHEILQHYKEEMEECYHPKLGFLRLKKLYEENFEQRVQEDSWMIIHDCYLMDEIDDGAYEHACSVLEAE